MAKKHYTVIDANNRIYNRRIDDNFGLLSTAPTVVAISSDAINLDSVMESSNFIKLTSGSLSIINGGQIGQQIVLFPNTTGGITFNYLATGSTSNNIVTTSSGSLTLTNTNANIVVMKTSTGSSAWTIISKST